MRKAILGIVVLILILFCFLTVSAQAEDLKLWNYSKNINAQGDNRYKEFFLDKDIYKYAQQNLSDLRIVDESGASVPYYIQNSYSNIISEKMEYDCVKTNEFVKKKDLYVDFKVKPLKENVDILGNRLRFTISEGKFLKNIEISGSFDGNEWQYIFADSIYKVDNIVKTEVTFNATLKYSYYRIKIPNNLEKIDITNMQVGYELIQKAQSSFEQEGNLDFDIKTIDKTTLINLKNINKLKVKQIQLDIPGNFNRHYLVLEKNGEDYIQTGINGELYKLHFSDLDISNTVIDLKNKPLSSEAIQVKIMNLDDKALDIKSIDIWYYTDKIIFEGARGSKYRLLFGNASAIKPSYDLEKFKAHIEKEAKDVGTLLELQTLTKQEAEKKGPDMVRIFNIVIVIIAIGLVFLIVRKLNFKKPNIERKK